MVDYGMGNLLSVQRACEREGANASVSADPSQIERYPKLILPGVGSFREAMQKIRDRGLLQPLCRAAAEGKAILGICLGMQLLASEGIEGGSEPCPGLNLIPGRVIPLQPENHERIPHVGWNEVHQVHAHPLLQAIDNAKDFYFVHSYHFSPVHQQHTLSTTPYCGSFSSMIASGRLAGTQFHPEKSSKVGSQLLRNFLDW